MARITRIGQDLTPLVGPSLSYGLPFGDEMRQALALMTACVIGVSGTGSLVAEQLARMGVGRLILIDFDAMGPENLNRIVNSTAEDARNKSLKPDMMAAAIETYNSDIEIVSVGKPIETVEAIQIAASADILFSCVDRMDARLIAERLCGACLIPLIDVGVTIPTRKDAAGAVHVAEIAGRIDYVRPDGPSLTDRRVVTPEGLRRDYLIDHAPQSAKVEIEAGYLKGAPDEAPAVMSVNMRAAATAVNEWLARLYGFRVDGNGPFARTLFLLASGEEEYASETEFPYAKHAYFAQGLAPPLLGLPGLAENSERAAA
ncbi:ThiF family adenylyltransferase [uncultured Maricaulis sp.]|uniref:HesA/MoeB/ThiF family protein n=1 Tax=uncultured Maricaulis sp. TaxID=174710 RepID=UPI0030DC8052